MSNINNNITSTEFKVLRYVRSIPNISLWQTFTMAEHAMAVVQHIETEKELDDAVIETSEIDDMTGALTDGVNRDLLNRLDEDYDDVLYTHSKMMEALGIPESLVELTEQQQRNWELCNEFLMEVHRIAGKPLTIYTR